MTLWRPFAQKSGKISSQRAIARPETSDRPRGIVNKYWNDVVLFPREAAEYGPSRRSSKASNLHPALRSNHAAFEQIASYYVLFTWVYDGFNEVPYLRLRGDRGCGKTRCLLTVRVALLQADSSDLSLPLLHSSHSTAL